MLCPLHLQRRPLQRRHVQHGRALHRTSGNGPGNHGHFARTAPAASRKRGLQHATSPASSCMRRRAQTLRNGSAGRPHGTPPCRLQHVAGLAGPAAALGVTPARTAASSRHDLHRPSLRARPVRKIRAPQSPQLSRGGPSDSQAAGIGAGCRMTSSSSQPRQVRAGPGRVPCSGHRPCAMCWARRRAAARSATASAHMSQRGPVDHSVPDSQSISPQPQRGSATPTSHRPGSRMSSSITLANREVSRWWSRSGSMLSRSCQPTSRAIFRATKSLVTRSSSTCTGSSTA